MCDFKSVPDGPASFNLQLVFNEALRDNAVLAAFFEYDAIFVSGRDGDCRIE
jgi:hypothetical protein